MYVHVVKKGESLYRIGRAMGVPSEDIAWINELETDTPGQTLLPGASLLIPTQVPTTLGTYTVQAGDTWHQLAHRFRIPETMLQAANPNMHAEWLPNGRVLTLPFPIQEKQAIEVNLRLQAQDDFENASTIRKADTSLTSVSLCSGRILPDGSISLPPQAKSYAEVVRKHSQAQWLLHLTPDDEQTVWRLLTHAETKRSFFSEIRLLIGSDHFAGMHLDFGVLPPAARFLLPGFVREAALRVHQKQGRLYLSVPSHTEDNPNHPRFGAYDLPWLCLYADRIVWNTEQSYARLEGPPTALAPLHLIRRSLDFSLRHVPREKLLLGLPFYGYDWPKPVRSPSKSFLRACGQPEVSGEWQQQPQQVHWDERAMSPMYLYFDAVGDRREVWYEDARSLACKLHLVQELGLGGVSCQVERNSCVMQWSLLLDQFRIRKG